MNHKAHYIWLDSHLRHAWHKSASPSPVGHALTVHNQWHERHSMGATTHWQRSAAVFLQSAG